MPLIACRLVEKIVAISQNYKEQEGLPETKTSVFYTPFDLRMISIKGLVRRILQYSKCSVSALVLGAYYIDRHASVLAPTPSKLHEIVLASMRVANKFMDDEYWNNRSYAEIGGISLKHMNIIELEFLKLIRWQCPVSLEQYDSFYKQLG
jgi:hypothetical protein